MLVLSRRLGELIFIRTPEGRQITITLVDIDRGKIRLGFEAEREVLIYREELLEEQDRLLHGKQELKNEG